MEYEEVIEVGTKEITIRLYNEPEDVAVRGNFASGDVEADRILENEIIHRHNSGDQWAWFCAKVEAECEGFTGVDYLGCCSYENLKDFLHPDGYYPSMRDEAIEDLKKQLLYAISRAELAKEVLEGFKSV